MIDVLADGAFPFTVAFVVMVLIGLMEGASLFFGASISGAIDSILPDLHVDIDHVGHAGHIDHDLAHPGHDGALTHLFSWLSIGRVPFLMLLVLFLAVFGLSGYTVQYAWQHLFGSMMPVWPAAGIASVLGLIGMGRLGAALARVMPMGHTDVASRNDLLGAVATVIRGEARVGYPAEAKAKDLRGNTHYILVEPKEGEPALAAGETAFVVRVVEGKNKYLVTNQIETNATKGD